IVIATFGVLQVWKQLNKSERVKIENINHITNYYCDITLNTLPDKSLHCVKVLPNDFLSDKDTKDQIVCGTFDSIVNILNIKSQTISTKNKIKCNLSFAGHSDWIRCVDILPNSRIVSGSDDSTLKIWNLVTKKIENTL